MGTYIKGLSNRERLLIPHLMHTGDASLKELSTWTGLREHVVRYVRDTLRERGVLLRRTPFINTYPMGFVGHTLYCSLRGEGRGGAQKLIAALRRQSLVSWAAVLSGEFEFAIAFLCRRPEELASAVSKLGGVVGESFSERHITTTLRFYAFVRKYLASGSIKAPTMYFGQLRNNYQIDEVDHSILSAMADGTYESYRELATRLAMHHTLLDRRIKKLREAGVISGFIYHCNLSDLGAQTHRLFVTVTVATEKLSTNLLRLCKEHPHVLRFLETIGPWDYEIEVEVYNPDELISAIGEIKELLGVHLVRLRSAQILRHLKFVPYPSEQAVSL